MVANILGYLTEITHSVSSHLNTMGIKKGSDILGETLLTCDIHIYIFIDNTKLVEALIRLTIESRIVAVTSLSFIDSCHSILAWQLILDSLVFYLELLAYINLTFLEHLLITYYY